jgi:hypothetical protein
MTVFLLCVEFLHFYVRKKSIFDHSTFVKVWFWTIELQNQLFLTIKLSKLFKFGNWAVLMGDFIFLFTI